MLKSLPKPKNHAHHNTATAKAVADLNPNERSYGEPDRSASLSRTLLAGEQRPNLRHKFRGNRH